MDELMQALTVFLTEGAAYFRWKMGQDHPGTVLEPACLTDGPPAAAPKLKKPRKKKEKAPVAAPLNPLEAGTSPAATPAEIAAQVPPAAKLTEEQSLEKMREVGNAVVARFKDTMADSTDIIRDVLAKDFKVLMLKDLQHPQRLQFIATMEAKLNEVAQVTQGTEV